MARLEVLLEEANFGVQRRTLLFGEPVRYLNDGSVDKVLFNSLYNGPMLNMSNTPSSPAFLALRN